MSTQYKNAFAKGVSALVESAKDGNEGVREQIITSLVMLSQKDFGTVLDTLCKFMKEHPGRSTPTNQRISLLIAIKKVVSKHDNEVSDELMKSLVEACHVDMIHGVDVTNAWQLQACDTVSEMMAVSPAVCIPFVAGHIPGTSLPNYFVMSALSKSALHAPHRFLPYLKDVMAKMLPILGMAKQENARYIMAETLASMGEVILTVFNAKANLTNTDEDDLLDGRKTVGMETPRSAPSKKFTLDEFNETMNTALSILVNDWSSSKELKVRTTVFAAIGRLAGVISKERLEEKLIPVCKILPAAVKKEKVKDSLLPLKGMTAFIKACMEKMPALLLPQLENVWQSVFTQIIAYTALPPQEQTDLIKIYQEAMRCVEAMCIGCTQTVLNFVQNVLDVKFGSKDPITRCAALGVIRHLILTPHCESLLAPLKNNVVAVVKTCVEDTDYRMKKVIVRTIETMGGCTRNNYLACEGADELLLYVVLCSSISPDVCRDWVLKNKKLAESGSYPTPMELKEVSTNVLELFHSEYTHLDTVQWPYLLEILGMTYKKQQIFYAFPLVCKAIISISQRLGNTHEFYFDFDSNVNVPKPEALIPLFCVMMSQPVYAGVEETEMIIRSMECICPLLDEPMKKGHTGETPVGSLWLALLPEMRDYLKSEEFKQDDYEEACQNLIKKTCQAKKEEAWVQSLAQQLGDQLPMYAPAEVPGEFLSERQDYKRVALSMYGIILSKAALKTFVGDSLKLLADVTDHTNEVQRQGIARGFGSASSAHCDLVLEKINRMAKKAQGGGGFFGKKAPTDGEKDYGELSRASCLLAFGQISKKANHSLFTSRLETHVIPTMLEILQTPAGKNPVNRIAALAGFAMISASLRKNNTAYSFASKQPVIMQIVSLMNVDPNQYGATNDVLNCNLLYHGLTALVPVLYLNPPLEKETFDLIACCIAAGLCKEWKSSDEKELKKGEMPSQFPLISEKEVQKQVGLLCNAVLENSGDVVKSFVSQGKMLSEYMHDPIAIRRERATKVYVVLLKHFGKTCDAKGITIPLCKVTPASPEAKSPDTPHTPFYLNIAPLDPKAKLPEKSTEVHRALAATFTAAYAVQKKEKKKEIEIVKPEEAPVDLSLGVVIARLLPRLCDVSPKTKTDALDGVAFCVKLSLLVADQHGQPSGVGLDQYERALEMIKEVSKKGLEFKDEAMVYAAMKEVTAALCLVMRNTKELPNLLENLLLFGLLDPVDDSAVGVCCILSGFLKSLSGVADNLNDADIKLILKRTIQVLSMLNRIPEDGRADTKRGTLLAIKAMAKNRPALIFNELNTHTVPHNEVLVTVIQTIANDTGLAKLILNHSLDVMLNSQLYNESYASGCVAKGDKLSLTPAILASCVTVGEVCQTEKGAAVAGSSAFKAPLLCSLFLELAAAHEAPFHPKDTDKKKKSTEPGHIPPAQLITTALTEYVRVVFPGAFSRFDDDVWPLFTMDFSYPDAVANLLLVIVHDAHEDGNKDLASQKRRIKLKNIEEGKEKLVLPPTTSCTLVSDVFAFINEYVSKTYDSQRRCALVMMCHLLYHCLEDSKLFQGIINNLLSRSGQDEQYIIKLQATKGFKHLPVHEYENIRLYVAPVISSLVGCCGDPSPEVILSAMRTLEGLIHRMNCKSEISAVTVNICLKTKAAIDSTDPLIRAASASLFRILCDLTVDGGIDSSTMEPNIYTHLPSVLTHMNDGEPAVAKSCKGTMHAMVKYFQMLPPSKKASDQLKKLFAQEHMQMDFDVNFDDFAHDFSKIFMKHFAAKSNDLLVALVAYFQSHFNEVRKASAIFSGFLLKYLSDIDQVCLFFYNTIHHSIQTQARSSLESATAGLIVLVKKDAAPDVRLKVWIFCSAVKFFIFFSRP